ncbi:MAG: hypothetical protein H0W76_19600, partial [Pyrinomonadaceae bacterium]|nr:hypothetical protein [Pyrinomonadaceae bacterium]
MKKRNVLLTSALALGHALALASLAQTSSPPGARPPAAAQPPSTSSPASPSQAQPQTPPMPRTSPPQQPQQQTSPRQQTPRAVGLDLAEYGVYFEPDPRLIVMMAALNAAGFAPTAASGRTSAFRDLVRKDQANLDPVLRGRLRAFYERYRLKSSTATSAEQIARYVTLAFVLGPAPTFEAPARSDDLPSELLEVLDFSSLLREFYQQSGIAERMSEYMRAHREAAAQVRPATAEMVRATLSYLHTRPQTSITERVPTNDAARRDAKEKKGGDKNRQVFTTRDKVRRFLVVPDLLGAPSAINFRIFGDDYYAVIPYGIDPASSELRRAYLQYVADPLVGRFSRDVAARRAELKPLLDERRKTDPDVSGDVFLAVSRSLVAAADARMNETARLGALARRNSERLRAATGNNSDVRAQITKESAAARQAIEDASTAQLADAYERGAVLAFFFAEQLRGLEESGFDVANFFGDMMASFNATREATRPTDYATPRARHIAAREKAKAAGGIAAEVSDSVGDARRNALFDKLGQVDQ